MAEHILKTWPNAFAAVKDGRKRFEWRKDDRGFEVGDVLVLGLYDPNGDADPWFAAGVENGRVESIRVRVSYIARGLFEIPHGYCIMSITLEEKPHG